MFFPLSQELTDGRLNVSTLDHAGLAFYRYLPLHLEDDGKRDHLARIAKRFGPHGPWDEAARFHADRMHAAAEAFRAQGRPVEVVEAKTLTRLLVGTGYKNALDIGLAFHPASFPFLPGSAVKGLCRAWAEDVSEQPETLLKRAFGTESKDEKDEAGDMVAGGVCFFDALPIGFPTLDVDLLNPHYPGWYRGALAGGGAEGLPALPVDWDRPSVVPFLAVAAGVPFRFLLVGRTPSDEKVVAVAADWLKQALAHLGAGAKTAAGYGTFDTESLPKKRPRPSSAAANPARARASAETKPAAPAVPRPDPEKLGSVGKNSSGVPAQVTGHVGRALRVRLHVEGYEGDTFEVGGVNGPEFARVGEWITVDVNALNKKGRVAQLSGPKKQA